MIHPYYNFSDVEKDYVFDDEPPFVTEVNPQHLERYSVKTGVDMNEAMCLEFINEILRYIHPTKRADHMSVVKQLNYNLTL